MVPLMTINSDDVMEASLLGPVEGESGPSPNLEVESILLGEGDGPSGVPGPAPPRAKTSQFVEPAKQNTTPLSPTAPHHHLSLKEGSPRKGLMLIPATLVSGSKPT